MEPRALMARDLAARFEQAGIIGHPRGAGVHWHVDLDTVDGRTARIHCFWYESVVHALMLGMNPSNGRSALRPPITPYDGPEYYMTLHLGGETVEHGRSRSVETVIVAARAWATGAGLEEIASLAPFIGAERRAMAAVAETLDTRLRVEAGDNLWVYGAQRSCRIGGGSCAFFVGGAQVAFAGELADLPGTVAAWLLDICPVSALAGWGVSIERHAEVLEVDPARWHWLHVVDRAADPHDVLAPLAPLLVRLAASPVVSRFYSFSSLNQLCFSASSHYPWVGDFPVVAPTPVDRVYALQVGRFDLEDTVRHIEAALASSPIAPFFGTARDLDLPLVAACFARQGSGLRPQRVQHQGFFAIEVATDRRSCRFGARSVTCSEGHAQWHGRALTLDDVVGLARAFLEDGASFEELAADSRVLTGSATPRAGDPRSGRA
jgi:hypothetical protein